MSENDKEVVEQPITNEYGLSDEEYAKARKEARAAVKGEAPAEEEKEVEVKEPVETPAQEETAEEADTTQQQAAGESQEDPLKDLPDEWKEKVASQLKAAKDQSEYFKKRYDSDVGRITAYQSKYEETRRALQAKEAEIAALKKTPPKPLRELDDPRIKQALEAGDEGTVDMLEAVRETVRKEFEAEFSALRKQQMDREREQLEAQQREAVDNFNRVLDSKWDNWRQVVYDHDEQGRMVVDEKNKAPRFNAGWQEYINAQPPGIAQAIVNISSAEDAIWAIDGYNEWLAKTGKIEQPEQASAAVVIPNAEAIQKKREGDLKRKSAPAGHQVPLSPNPNVDITDEATEKRLRALAREAIKKRDASIYSPRNL